MREIVIIAHDMRSCHNVGSLLRTAEGLGVTKVYLSGYTPYPLDPQDKRLPHEANKIDKQISKTALGAEKLIPWEHHANVVELLKQLRASGFRIIALEQDAHSIPLPTFVAPEKIAILLGREVEGIDPLLLAYVDQTIEIPMFGQKESFNVVQATAMALYHCRFYKH